MAARRGGRFAGALPHKGLYPAGANVDVDAKLYGVKFGDGAYGAEDISLNFAIGRRQVVKAAAPSHRIQVVTDEGIIMDFACSYGEGDLPRNITRSGVHVVTEKYEDFYMCNPAAGYSNVHERFAVRISNNGEFIHCNPNSIGAAGQHERDQRLHQPEPRKRTAVLQQCDLRRPGRGDRHLDRIVLRRRRPLGLGCSLG